MPLLPLGVVPCSVDLSCRFSCLETARLKHQMLPARGREDTVIV